MAAFLFFHIRVTNVKLITEKNNLILQFECLQMFVTRFRNSRIPNLKVLLKVFYIKKVSKIWQLMFIHSA